MFFHHLRRYLLLPYYFEMCPQLVRPLLFGFFMYATSCMVWYFSFDGWILPADASGLMIACLLLNYIFFLYVNSQLKRAKKKAKGNRTLVQRLKTQIRIMNDVRMPLLCYTVFMLQYLISSIFYFQTPNILQYYFQIAILGRDSRGD